MGRVKEEVYKVLSERVEFNDDGVPRWLANGKIAGCIRKDNGYRVIRAGNNQLVRAHRLNFYMENDWLPEYIDHIDGDSSNNRIGNLRPCTIGQNSFNSKPRGGASKYKGVCRSPNRNRWKAEICISKNCRSTHLGYFDTEEEAALSYDAVAHLQHGEFAWLNIDNFEDL